MKEDIVRTIVFFVLIIVIALSALGTWRVITTDIPDSNAKENTIFPEKGSSSGYVSININQEGNQENE